MRRFYKQVTIGANEGGGFSVLLDGKPVKTPARSALTMPTATLAEAVAGEWANQGEEIDPAIMPMTSYATTAIDRVASQRENVIKEIAGYAGSDLLCHRADEPDELVDRQNTIWQPLLDWCEAELGASLEVSVGIMPLRQSEAALAAVHKAVAKFADPPLAGLHALTSGCGSVVIALAITSGRMTAEEGFAASQVDETWQTERWGEDEEAADKRARLRREVLAAAKFVKLCTD
ncbi:MAG: ATPase [Rhodospirillaceae bacterium]|jgi:chaperone required for assembly of F1-ATPase|nr:ATPase [Rhodospirillaceae bacterium]MBT6137038.1 ATPase [Rhodospirillaceae bacterium]